MDNPSQSILYLSTGTLAPAEREKTQNFEKKKKRERGFCNVIHDFSFFKHPRPLEMNKIWDRESKN